MTVYNTDTELYDGVKRKLDILQKISTNTKIQIEFIHRRNIKGLLRLLEERGQYLQDLEILSKALDNTMLNTEKNKNRVLLDHVEAKQIEIIRDNKIALAAAEAERDYIMADLRRVSKQIKLCNSYDYQWVNFAGGQVNQKG